MQGRVRLFHMKRLSEILLNSEGDADVSLDFSLGHDGTHLVKGIITTRLGMICQRCLGPLNLNINRPFELAFTYNEHESRRLLDSYECYEVSEGEVFVRNMIEDELLLSVPQIPMHPSFDDCDAEFTSRLGSKNNMMLATNLNSSFMDLKK